MCEFDRYFHYWRRDCQICYLGKCAEWSGQNVNFNSAITQADIGCIFGLTGAGVGYIIKKKKECIEYNA